MMESVHLPKGLIRYDSEEGIATKTPWKITPRVIGYSIILLLIVGLEITLLATRADIGMSVIRARGSLFQVEANGHINNLYNIKFINKTSRELPVELRLKDHQGIVRWIGKESVTLAPEETKDEEFFLVVDPSEVPTQKNKWKLECWSDGKKIGTENITFIAPHQN
jgi:polyferredoxin